MILETICVGPMQVNCYILASGAGKSAIIIDPGAEIHKINKLLNEHSLSPSLIINTHGHYDHIGCDDKFKVPIYIHSLDLALLKNPQLNLSGLFALPYHVESEIRGVEDKEVIESGGIQLKVLHVPGHTPGGISLLLEKPKEKVVFTGDSLFCSGIGRTDFAEADESLLLKSIKEKLFTLPDETIVYPGHGPSSTIGEEKRNNPFFT
jgi:glyoxylase-like metal-dependent hydrolase (beta-lactamase superfamily II)